MASIKMHEADINMRASYSKDAKFLNSILLSNILKNVYHIHILYDEIIN